jgi:hypothetical protein
MGQMKKYSQLLKEMPSKTVVFAFGRFNPPTVGHELLVKMVKKVAQQKRGDHVIFASKTQDKKKNPLSIERKLHYLNMMFPQTHFMGANQKIRTFIEAAKYLNTRYKNIVMVAGSDRVPEFTRLLNQYNGKEYNFDSIEVISAGERDPDADNASGMSATKMRTLASKGSFIQFKRGLPSTIRDIDARRLMNDIRQGMGMDAVREQVVFKKDQLREQYFNGDIFNVGDIVESNEDVYMIVKRGSNHLLVQETTGEFVSKWIQDVQPSEREFMLDEGLSNKTLKQNDKIKVARVIATLLGVDNAESQSNPTTLVNLGLRRIRTKALNKEAISLIKKMTELADQMEIKYDTGLLPTKLKEGAMQPNGTDKIKVDTGSVAVNTNSKRNIAKDILRFNDFKKLKKVQEEDQDLDDEFEDASPTSEVGGLMNPPYSTTDDNLRRRKVKYMSEADTGEAERKRARKEQQRAALQLKQAKQRENLAAQQAQERDKLKNEETDAEKNARHHKDLNDLEQSIRKSGQMDKDMQAHFDAKRKELALKKEELDEVSSTTLNSYIKKSKEDGDKASDKGDHDKAFKRTMGRMTATGKLIGKKADSIVNNLNKMKEEKDTEKELASKERDAKTKGAVRPSGKVTDIPQETVVVENCYDDLSHGGGPVVDVDDVTSSINPPHDEKFENSGVDHTDDVGAYEKQISVLDMSDEAELNAIVNSMSDDEIIELAYEDDEVTEVDEDGFEVELDEEEKQLDEELKLMEVLSRMERIKARQRLKRTAAKRKRSTKIAMKRISSSKTANKRARRAAIKKVKERLLRGRNTSQLSVAEKERLERFVAKKKSLVNRLAIKMLPRIRQIEKKRMARKK